MDIFWDNLECYDDNFFCFKTKKCIYIMLVISIVLGLFSSCRGDDSQFKFAYDLKGDPGNMDPQIAESSDAHIVLANVMEGLLTYDSNGEIIGGVAKDYTISEDGLVYTFYLREDANWVKSDGEVYTNVTANDFKYAFTRLFEPLIASPFAYNFSAVKNAGAILRKELAATELGIKVVDSYTLRITLEYDYPMFLQLLTTPQAMPCNQEFFIETKGTYGLESKSLLYNGPFYMSSWNEETSVTARKNPHYNSSEPVIASSVMFFIPGNENAVADEPEENNGGAVVVSEKTPLEKFETGTTDAIVLSADQTLELDVDKYNSQLYEDTLWLFLLNTNNDVLKNRNIRLALTHSINKALYADIFPVSMIPSGALIPHIVSGADGESYRQNFGEDLTVEYNPQIAKTYLNQGLADLDVFSFPKITIIYPENDDFTQLLQNIQRQWQSDLSIFINISPLPDDEVRASVAKGDYDIALTSIRCTSNSPASILRMFTKDSPFNYTGYDSVQYDRLLNQAATDTDLREAYSLYSEAEESIIMDSVLYPLAYQSSSYLVRKNVQGVFFLPFGDIVYFKYGIIL